MDLDHFQYRLWARLMSSCSHKSKDTPPQVPLITGVTPTRKKKCDQVTIVSTAAAVVKAVSASGGTLIQSPTIQQTVQDSPISDAGKAKSVLGVSPGKAADIRGKSFGQLSALKQLYDENVLTQAEFEEQKNVILSGLKKL